METYRPEIAKQTKARHNILHVYVDVKSKEL